MAHALRKVLLDPDANVREKIELSFRHPIMMPGADRGVKSAMNHTNRKIL